MTTDVHFVKNNPFILNDYRYNSNSRLPTSASSIHIPSNYRSQTSLQTDSPVLQSASCSNIQKTVVSSNRFEDFSTAAVVNSQGQAPPIPHSVFRRFRLVSEMKDSSTPTTPTAMPMPLSTASQNRQNYSTMHSSSISSITTAAATAKAPVEGDWFNRGRLEHSQSHGAISHLQQPLKLQVDEYNNNNNNNDAEMKTDEDGKSCKFNFLNSGDIRDRKGYGSLQIVMITVVRRQLKSTVNPLLKLL